MKIKEILKIINQSNKLRDEIQQGRAYLELYINDAQIGKEIHDYYEFKYYIESEYIPDTIEEIEKLEFVKTYNCTLSASFKLKLIHQEFEYKVDLFIDLSR